MVVLKFKIQNVINKIPASVYAFFSIIVGLIGDLLAMILFPDFNFSYMISALGAGPGGIFFNIGLILSGVFCLGFYPYLARVIKTNIEQKKLIMFAKVSAITSCIFYSLIGFFPAIVELEVIVTLHGLSVAICWITAAMYLIAFGFLFLRSSNFLKIHAVLSFVTAATFFIVLLTWNPITEWIMTFAIISWIAIMASYTITNKF